MLIDSLNEKEILTQVIEARASATKLTVDIKDAEQLAEYQAKQQGLSQALGRLMMITEKLQGCDLIV